MSSELKECPACKQPVAVAAELCPKCGLRLQKPPQSAVGVLAAAGIGLVAGVVLLKVLGYL
jgi:predicted amidophosphoribosyltransferase